MFVEEFFDTIYALVYLLVWDCFFKYAVYLFSDIFHEFFAIAFDRLVFG